MVTLGLVGWPRNAVSQGWNKFSNSFYGGRWAALDFGGTRDHTWVLDKLEVCRHGVVEWAFSLLSLDVVGGATD